MQALCTLPNTTSRKFFKICKDGHCTTPLGKLCEHPVILMVKTCFYKVVSSSGRSLGALDFSVVSFSCCRQSACAGVAKHSSSNNLQVPNDFAFRHIKHMAPLQHTDQSYFFVTCYFSHFIIPLKILALAREETFFFDFIHAVTDILSRM